MYEGSSYYFIDEICDISIGTIDLSLDESYYGKYTLILNTNNKTHSLCNKADYYGENIVIPMYPNSKIMYVDYPFSTCQYNFVLSIKSSYINQISTKYLYFYMLMNRVLLDDLYNVEENILELSNLKNYKVKLPHSIMKQNDYIETYEKLLNLYFNSNMELTRLENEMMIYNSNNDEIENEYGR
jgi:hypothetical protein